MCLNNLADLKLCTRHEDTSLRSRGDAYLDAELRAELAPAYFFADTASVGELEGLCLILVYLSGEMTLTRINGSLLSKRIVNRRE